MQRRTSKLAAASRFHFCRCKKSCLALRHHDSDFVAVVALPCSVMILSCNIGKDCSYLGPYRALLLVAHLTQLDPDLLKLLKTYDVLNGVIVESLSGCLLVARAQNQATTMEGSHIRVHTARPKHESGVVPVFLSSRISGSRRVCIL